MNVKSGRSVSILLHIRAQSWVDLRRKQMMRSNDKSLFMAGNNRKMSMRLQAEWPHIVIRLRKIGAEPSGFPSHRLQQHPRVEAGDQIQDHGERLSITAASPLGPRSKKTNVFGIPARSVDRTGTRMME